MFGFCLYWPSTSLLLKTRFLSNSVIVIFKVYMYHFYNMLFVFFISRQKMWRYLRSASVMVSTKTSLTLLRQSRSACTWGNRSRLRNSCLWYLTSIKPRARRQPYRKKEATTPTAVSLMPLSSESYITNIYEVKKEKLQ